MTTLSKSYMMKQLSEAESQRTAAELSHWVLEKLPALESDLKHSPMSVEQIRQMLQAGDPPLFEFFKVAKILQIRCSQIYRKLNQMRDQGPRRFHWPDQHS